LSNSSNNFSSHCLNQELVPSSCPLVTVIIPTYNRRSLIREAIESVITQTYKNWELVVVDDGSTDGTKDFIKSISDQRIRLVELQHWGNIAQVRNAGVEAASGEWIAFLDSDDTWLPQKLEIQIGLLLKEKKRWGYGGFELMNEEGKTIPIKYGSFYPFSGWISRQLITGEATVPIGSLIIERNFFNELNGFNTHPKLFCREDYELTLRLALHAEVSAVPNTLVRVRDHSKRTTNSFTNGPERTANVYKHFYKSCKDRELKMLCHKQYAYHLADAGEKNLYQKKYLRAIKYFYKSIVNGDNPRHLLSSFKHGFIKH
jgi:glycosyltransferase involved in cell wall biosynthesis